MNEDLTTELFKEATKYLKLIALYHSMLFPPNFVTINTSAKPQSNNGSDEKK